MPRVCTICGHKKRKAIDSALIRDTYRNIAAQFRVSTSALARHRAHVGKAIQKASQRREENASESLYNQMRALLPELRGLLKKMKLARDWRGGVVAVRTAGEIIDKLDSMLARAAGGEARQISIQVHYGDQRFKRAETREALPEQPVDVVPQIVVRRIRPELPEPVPEVQPERPALPPGTPGPRVERVESPGGGMVVVRRQPDIFNLKEPL